MFWVLPSTSNFVLSHRFICKGLHQFRFLEFHFCIYQSSERSIYKNCSPHYCVPINLLIGFYFIRGIINPQSALLLSESQQTVSSHQPWIFECWLEIIAVYFSIFSVLHLPGSTTCAAILRLEAHCAPSYCFLFN